MAHCIKFGPQNLSELVAAEQEETGSFYGVVVDKFCPNRIKGAETISFVAALDEPDQISFDVIDTMIQYRQAKSNVLLEVPFDFPIPAHQVLVLANSINVSVVLPPPEEKTPENWATWANMVKEYARALFEVQGFSGEILPVTSYVQYMAMQVMGYTPESLTDDVMMHRYFEQGMDISVMDSLKAELHQIILDGNGGEKAFEVLVQSTLSALNDSIISEGKDRLEYLKNSLSLEDQEQLTTFLSSVLAGLGHDEVKEVVATKAAVALKEIKDPEQLEAHLKAETATEQERVAIESLVKFVRTVIN